MRDQLLELIRNDNKNKNSNATKLNQPDKTSRETDTMAKYVNLNRFVLFSGYSRNVAYFFNNDTLDSNELLKQLLHVLSFIGIEVFGVSSDSGGSNRGLFALLRMESN